MEWLTAIRLRLRTLARRRQLDRDLEEELRFHLAMREETYREAGLAPDEARDATRRRFGNTTTLKEACRDMWTFASFETLAQDVRYGVRTLAKNRGFTAVAVLTLALGIGANTAIFSVIDAVLLRPLPFPNPDRLVAVKTLNMRDPAESPSVSYPDFEDWRAGSASFEAMAVYHTRGFVLREGDEPVRVTGASVSADLFRLLGADAAVGRTFRPEEDRPGEHVVVLGDRLWRERFGADPSVVGRVVTLNDAAYTVVGVAQPGFKFPVDVERTDLWTTIGDEGMSPTGMPMTAQRGFRFLDAIGRLRPGVSLAAAETEMAGVVARLREQYPDDDANLDVRLVAALDDLVGDVRAPLYVLFGAVGFVLLIACANVANLLLARASARRREIALRSALGASRWRVVRQLLTESLLLALAGAAGGWLVALAGMRLLVAFGPDDVPRLGNVGADARVLGFTLVAAVVTGVVFGLAPAMQTSKTDLTEPIKEGGRAGAGAGGKRLRGALAVAEVAVALILMVGAGLLITSFWRLTHVDPGFDPRGVLTLHVGLPEGKYSDPDATVLFENLRERLAALPGVRSAGMSFAIPFGTRRIGTDLEVDGHPVPEAERPHVDCEMILPDYFRTMGIKLVGGRDFTTDDDAHGRPVVIVNETLARRFFPGEDAVGKRIRPDISSTDDAPAMREIVGVVGDVKYRGFAQEPVPIAYMPYGQMSITNDLTVVLRTDGEPHGVAGAARDEVRAMESAAVVHTVKSLDEYVSASVAYPRLDALLVAVFAGVALALALIGLYGVMSYTVTQRTHELGVRIALGASRRDVLGLVVGYGMRLVVVGMVAGLAGAFALTRLMASLLFGVSATDPVAFGAVAVALAAVALAACYIPARRATRVDPVTALRHE
jgi:putative ABC transport system permease protein